jgi:fumarate hydratase subunit beta
MSEVEIKTPVSEEQIRSLALGDIVFISGEIYTARDEAHLRALKYQKEGKEIPVAFADSIVFHCGPIMQKDGEKWNLVAAGPTTSSRMNSLEPDFIKNFNVRGIIGKGGMSNVDTVFWFDLGMPEALWVLNGNRFGPLIVAMDSHGKSLYDDVNKKTQENLPSVREKLGL